VIEINAEVASAYGRLRFTISLHGDTDVSVVLRSTRLPTV